MKLFDASLDNYELRILDISDTFNAQLVRHEFINTDGARIDNMGNRAREIRMKSFWYGFTTDNPSNALENEIKKSVSAPANYTNHYNFLDEMTNSSISHTLKHPKYGIVYGYIEQLQILHNDTQDYVEIDITFVEKDIKNAGFISDKSAIDVIILAKDLEIAQLEIEALSAEAPSSVLGQIIDKSRPMLNQINTTLSSVRTFVNDCDNFCNRLDTFLADVVAPLDTVNTFINYAGNLPTRVLSSIVNVSDRIMETFGSLITLPSQFVNNFTLQIDNLARTIPTSNSEIFHSHLRTMSCSRLGSKIGSIYANDSKVSAQRRASESKIVFDEKGNRIYDYTPVAEMTVEESEYILSVLRYRIQEEITYIRANQSVLNGSSVQGLKNMANNLINYLGEIKLTKKAVQTVNVNSIPMHLLMNQLGLSYQAAERTLQLNPQIKNPTFSEGAVKVYVS